MHACDKSQTCFDFIRAHKHPPIHLHRDIFGRLSQSAVAGLTQAEADAAQALSQMEEPKDKTVVEAVGVELLDAYMRVLHRPGSIMNKAMCDSEAVCPGSQPGLMALSGSFRDK